MRTLIAPTGPSALKGCGVPHAAQQNIDSPASALGAAGSHKLPSRPAVGGAHQGGANHPCNAIVTRIRSEQSAAVDQWQPTTIRQVPVDRREEKRVRQAAATCRLHIEHRAVLILSVWQIVAICACIITCVKRRTTNMPPRREHIAFSAGQFTRRRSVITEGRHRGRIRHSRTATRD